MRLVELPEVGVSAATMNRMEPTREASAVAYQPPDADLDLNTDWRRRALNDGAPRSGPSCRTRLLRSLPETSRSSVCGMPFCRTWQFIQQRGRCDRECRWIHHASRHRRSEHR